VRPPDWLIYGAIVGIVLGLALSRRERVMAPAPPPPVPGAAQLPIGPDSPFAAAPIVAVPVGALAAARTAFSVSEAGAWISAGAAPCVRPAVVVAGGRAVPARAGPVVGLIRAYFTPGAGTPGLPLAPARTLRAGKAGFHLGYPEDGPGEVASRLIGARILRPPARETPDGPVLAWAEVGRTEGLNGARRGLIGAPVLDAEGRVVGVTVALSPRRGRLYASLPGDLDRVLVAAKTSLGAPGPGEPIGPDNYGRAADDLRRDLRIVQLVCLG
jgi:hypothetical protein